jgi:hypothetical protein
MEPLEDVDTFHKHSDVNMRGMHFANHAATSLLARRMNEELGCTAEPHSEVWDKDYGDGAIAYFDCGEVVFTRQLAARGSVPVARLYQSRLSDDFHFEVGSHSLSGLTLREYLNDEFFVDDLMEKIKELL